MSLNTPNSEPQMGSQSSLRRKMSTLLGASALVLSMGCQNPEAEKKTDKETAAESFPLKPGLTRRGRPTLRVKRSHEDKKDAAKPESKRDEVKDCLVKGNVSSKGKKLYHIADACPDYEAVKINKKGEKCFDTEEEAVEAGWKKAGNCK